MLHTKKIINDNQQKFSEFQYYISIINIIETNVTNMPDVTIESCKALLEGICKTILRKYDIAFIDTGKNADSSRTLLKKVLSILDNSQIKTDIELLNNTCNIVSRMSQIRNESGDISHGKSSPKQIFSTKEMGYFIMQLTDAVANYLLYIYFNTDLSYIETRYEDYKDFNAMLDENYPLEGIVSFSKALYNQDKTSYEQQLYDYRSSTMENES